MEVPTSDELGRVMRALGLGVLLGLLLLVTSRRPRSGNGAHPGRVSGTG